MKSHGDGGLRACLVPLLDSLGTGGGTEAALRGVEMGEIHGLRDMLNAMAVLGFTNRTARISLSSLDATSLPSLVATAEGKYLVVLRRDGDSLFVFDGETGKYRRHPAALHHARAWRFFPLAKEGEAGPSRDWFWMVAGRFRRYLVLGSLFSLVLGGLSLLYPVLMTAMYGKLSATSEARFVASLAIGAILYLSADAGLRFLRGALLDYSSARFGQTIGAEIFRRLLSFQTSFTESAPLDSQIRRVRDFETIADFISGPAFAAIFDVPFLLLNVFWLAAAGPSFLIAPAVAIIVFAVATAAFFPIVRKAQAAFSVEDGLRHDLFARIIAAKSQLSDTAAKESWVSRFSRASRSASLAGYELQRVNGLVSSFSSLVVSLGGLATLYFGVLDVFAGKARPEALVVAMLLVWRILEPARSAFVVVTQLDSVMKSVEQIKRFLTLPLELPSLLPRAAGRQPRGGVAFHEVFFRYGSEGYPALSGIGFEVPQGGIFTIGGHAGSGKTTIAKLLLGLYRPQSGRITLGGQNILQIDPALLRRSVAFAPGTAPLFPGSLLANIRLGAPEATDRSLIGLAEEIGLVAALSERGWTLDTLIGPRELDAVPVEIARLIALVRTFARSAGVLIVDEPQKGVPKSSLIRVASLLSRRREDGDTVIIITNDGYFSSLSDEGLVLDGGRASPRVSVAQGAMAREKAS